MKKYTYLVHGRPRYYLNPEERALLEPSAHRWRRQHAVTVWNAMAAVVAVAAAFEVGYCMLDKAVSDAKMRELIARCNWKESKPQ